MITRLIGDGAFDQAGAREEVRLALQEVVRTIQAAHHIEPSISACERLVAALFIRACDQTVTLPSALVTLQESKNP